MLNLRARRWTLPSRLRAALRDCVRLGWMLLALALLLATLKTQLARAAEFPSDVGAGTLLFQTRDGGFDSAVPIATDLRISVAGVVARVAVAQRFRNTSADWLEALYVLPLPDDAAVDRMKMQIGDRVVEGEIHERQRAEQIYSEARAAGQRASLVRQTSANLFTTAVANIAPGESIDVTIEYLQTARYEAGEFTLRVPMTVTPRYGAPDAPEVRSAMGPSAVPEPSLAPVPTQVSNRASTALAARAAPTHLATVHAVVVPGVALAEIGGRGHALQVSHERGSDRLLTGSAMTAERSTARVAGAIVRSAEPADVYRLETLTPRVPMDRDLVIAWRPEIGSAPVVAALSETRGDTTYSLLMLLPPADAAAASVAQPREQIFVIDTSGSMGGQSIEQAKAALVDALARLRSADRFNVLEFNSHTSSLFRTPVPFTRENHEHALRYVDGLTATGGTEMESAIRAALAQPTTSGYLRQVIFVTDGAVGGETRLFSAIKQNLGDARLFTIGIGSAPNGHFMRKAAQFGRGSFTYVGETADVASEMRALFDKLEHVALTDVVVDWPEAAEFYPNQVPDLYAGEPLLVAASFPAQGDRAIRAAAFGAAGGVPWSQTVRTHSSDLPGIAALWARRKIEHLIDSRVDGISETLIRTLVTETALEHHLVSPYTSLVAVDRTPARSAAAAALRRQALMSTTPHGASWTIAFPSTATPAVLFRRFGLLLLLLAAATCVLTRPRVAVRLPRRPLR